MRTPSVTTHALIVALAAAGLATVPVVAHGEVSGQILGTISLGGFDEGATEIVAYHPGSQTLFSVNGETQALDLISLADPASPSVTKSVSLPGDPTSVAVSGDLVAVAVLAPETGEAGSVVFLDASVAELGRVAVGMHPDMVAFTPDGTKVLIVIGLALVPAGSEPLAATTTTSTWPGFVTGWPNSASAARHSPDRQPPGRDGPAEHRREDVTAVDSS